MKKDLTEVVFILDRSGSMNGLEADTIGGYNSFLEKQKNQEGECIVSSVLFNNRSKVIHNRKDIKTIEPMTAEDYSVGGGTALLDAIGDAIHHITLVHSVIREEDVPEKTIFVITTDGMENSSTRYSFGEINKTITALQKNKGWEFIFLGANMDAVSEAGKLGISLDRAANYCCDSVGTELNFSVVSNAVSSIRRRETLDSSWKNEIEKYSGR